ncbi:25899_t:CDS:2, partial [Gigaspora rosea]
MLQPFENPKDFKDNKEMKLDDIRKAEITKSKHMSQITTTQQQQCESVNKENQVDGNSLKVEKNKRPEQESLVPYIYTDISNKKFKTVHNKDVESKSDNLSDAMADLNLVATVELKKVLITCRGSKGNNSTNIKKLKGPSFDTLRI